MSWVGCSEDFEVAAPAKDITVVYGMLRVADTAHYVRIQKAFLDEHKSAISMAQEADSNFYGDLEVRMKEISGNSVISNTLLSRVDLNTEGYQKEPGLFFTSPNYAYKYKHTLNPAWRYRLVITNPATGDVDSSEVALVDTSKLHFHSFPSVIKFANLEFDATPPTRVIPQYGTEVGYLECILRFKWKNVNTVNGSMTEDSADLIVGSAPTDVTKVDEFHIQNAAIYAFLRDEIGIAPDNVVRHLDSCHLLLNAAGRDYAVYVRTNQIQSGGLTADQIKPIYTNILGTDAYGLFSSRGSIGRYNLPIDTASYDALRANPLTQPLKIVGYSTN